MATYLSRTSSTATNSQKFTASVWIKLTDLSNYSRVFQNYADDLNRGYFQFASSGDAIPNHFFIYDRTSSATNIYYESSRKFRDVNGWYHVVLEGDSTLASANDRLKIYINGEDITSNFTKTNTIAQNANFGLNVSSASPVTINSDQNGNNSTSLLMSHFHFCDGYAYDASYFGENDANGVWKIKTDVSVTYGNNGFFILKDSGSVTDQSGNGNNFTVAGGTLTNTEDNPSNVFAVINNLTLASSQYTLINGNLSTNGNGSNAWRSIFSTLGVTQGKYYFEMKVNAIEASDTNNFVLGICDIEQIDNSASNGKFFGTSRGYGYHAKNGDKLNNDTVTANGVAYGDSWTTNDIIGCAFDLDNGKLYWSKNGTWQNSGDPTSGATGTGSAFDVTTGYTYVPVLANYYSAEKVSFNFGNGYFGTTAVASAGTNASGHGIFEYDVPTGYTALCTKGLNGE